MYLTRVTVDVDRLVYVFLADKKFRYENGQSRIVYVGTTKRGARRMAASAAQRSDEILGLRGVEAFDVRVVTCKPRQSIRTWHKLERALLLAFRERFGDVPVCNGTGHRMKEGDEFDHFSRSRVEDIIDELS